MILMIIIWDLVRTKKKFDSTLLRGGYMKVISDLKNKNSKLYGSVNDKNFGNYSIKKSN